MFINIEQVVKYIKKYIYVFIYIKNIKSFFFKKNIYKTFINIEKVVKYI